MTLDILESAGTAPSGTPETPTSGGEAPASETPQSAPSPTQPSADPDALPDIPADKLAAYLERNPDLKKAALRDVRQRDIDKRAEEKAVEKAKAAYERSAQLEEALSRMVAEREQDRLSRMTDDEKSTYLGSMENQALKARLARFETMYVQTEEERARDAIIEAKADEWGLSDDDQADLRKITNSSEFMAEAMRRAANRVKSERESRKTLEERLAAIERVQSGSSTYAAIAGNVSGGDMSQAQLEDSYLRMTPDNPDYTRIEKLYRASRGR
jgi:hypothetical protein